MSQVEVERFLGRIITDMNFRARAATSLGNACYTEGFVISLEEMALLGRLDLSHFEPVAEALDDSIRRG